MTQTAMPYQEEEYSGRFDPGVWRRVLRFLVPYRYFMGGLFTVALLTGCAEAGFTLLSKVIIDDVVANGAGAAFGMHAWALVSLTVFFFGCVWGLIRLSGHVSTGVAHDIRAAGFARLQELSFSFYDRRSAGWLVSRMTSDCDRLARFISWGFLDITWGICMLVAIAVVMLALQVWLALAVLAVMPVLVWVSMRFQKLLLATSREARRCNSDLTAAVSEGIMGVRTTKALVREARQAAEFGKLADRMFDVSVRNAVVGAAFRPLMATIASVGAAVALCLGGMDVLSALPTAMSLGTLIAFVSYAGQIRGPMDELSRVFATLQQAQAAGERIIGLIETEPEIRDRVGCVTEGAAVPARIESIEFRHVDFGYKEGEPVLRDFDLTVRQGQTVALVGPTGGGKTTITALACRFYEPTAGAVLVNGVDIRALGLHWLQSRLGIVLQDPHLFSGTIRENIRYGRLDADPADVEQAARLARAHDFIARLPSGYESQVGEGGVKLSTGQKQLVAFARAILAAPQVMVLDEATASVDTETEQLIQQGLAAVLRGRISLVIAHRLSTVRAADRILLIDGGRIVEQGTHRELIAARGKYYDLCREQMLRTETA